MLETKYLGHQHSQIFTNIKSLTSMSPELVLVVHLQLNSGTFRMTQVFSDNENLTSSHSNNRNSYPLPEIDRVLRTEPLADDHSLVVRQLSF